MSGKNIEAIYPLSPMQEGMLFHTLYAPTSGVYFEQLSCTLVGALDLVAFKQAWQQIVDRHAVLRTLFVWQNRDKPLQVVRQQVALPWIHHDWRGIAPEEQEQRLAAFLVEDRAQAFALMHAPLMRCTVIQLGETLHQFVWSFHHLLLDGWSVSHVLQEVFALYETLYHRRPLYLEPARSYREYIAWLQNQDIAGAEAFWRQVLSGFITPTPLGGRPVRGQEVYPTDQERDHARFRVRLDLKTTTALNAAAKQYRLTLSTLAQGAWGLLLSRYAGEQDVLFGVTVSGRPAEIAGIENMIGLFINTLPLRVHVPAQGTLLAWLQALQMQQADIRQYEFCALTDIQRWSDVPSSLPLFESILVFENYPTGAILQSTSIPLEEANRWYKADGLEIRNIRFFERTNYPLTISVEPGAELVLEFDYNPVYFDTDTIRRMAKHLQTLLENMPASLEQPLVTLSMLSLTERQQVLVDWNATRVDFPDTRCVHQLFEAQVERTPDAVAVVGGQQTLTYRELNRRANQLAHHLQSLGMGPETLVGLYIERTPEMIVSLLGILKAGGAYVPLDPAYPSARLATILEDVQVCFLITQQHLAKTLPVYPENLISIDADWDVIARNSDENPGTDVADTNAAYVIYTSGSTGTPKGVVV
ncbi:MAG: AMP-binding protein, partial [Anaerolineae bacterium]|nr:AMP-binding protein [Anaerolineae bacterium]